MRYTDARSILDRIYYHMLDTDLDGKDWAARQFIADHMRQFPVHHEVPTETPKEVTQDGFQLT
jgi:hypothetical protein